ncbi:MAG TPA: aldolase/citrate lyase family protein [Solirubrobacteraceae bacterium]|jgi:citrate lyase beta subunit|nr:aldolase/citrate lyase family protein [Solirubrobacteraceae bacterium]
MTVASDRIATRPRRSCLSVPGHAERMHEKALTVAADEVVFDLEDAVAPSAKAQARETIAATLSRPEWAQRTVAVRLNAPGSNPLSADLELISALVPGERLTVVVPKVQAPEELAAIAQAIDPAIGLQALIETPAGIEAVAAIARSTPRLRTLILGYADLATALGRRGAETDLERWLYHQEAVLAAARAAGVQAIDGPFLRLGEPLALTRAARAARELGFDGKWAIHPEQVEPLNRAFGASEQELRWAGAVRDALAAAADSGDAAVRVQGAMVDEAMRAHALRLQALPRAAEPAAPRALSGPAYYEDLQVGQVFRSPGLTLTDGHAALHQAIVGDRLRLSLDAPLCREVTGAPSALAHPMLVCDVAIGQSTEPSGRVLGNLFYRGLAARPVHVGATLRTTTTVAAKRRTRGRQARGMVLLHVTALDDEGQVVLDYLRCPLLPARGEDPGEEGDDIQAAADAAAERDAHDLIPAGWRLDALRREPLGTLFADLRAGQHWALEAGETVSGAPELARLSLNLAMTHTDASAGAYGQRLVYGGHVIGVAASHLTKVLPDLATVLAWRSCDHLGPTFEGELLHSEIILEALQPLPDGGLLDARILVSAQGDANEDPRPVLDWRLTALMP